MAAGIKEEAVAGAEYEDLPDFSWMVRPCEMYKLEHDDCSSIKGHFHQYFIFGAILDCSQWKMDHDNCMKWRKNGDAEALNKVIESEKARVATRMKAMFANDVWKLRTEPLSPSIWNSPLPDWITKDHPNSYLQSMKTHDTEPKDSGQLCTIL